jgi:hypothetical protein
MKRISLIAALISAGVAAAAVPALSDTAVRRDGKTLTPGIGGLKGAGVPDLIIEPRYAGHSGLPSTGYCGQWNGGNQRVYFYVRNVGSAQAPASDAYVGFGGDMISMVAVPALQPGQSSLRSVSIPLAAWGPSQYESSADFLIAADHNDDVPEDDVTNNYGEGSCLGPAT